MAVLKIMVIFLSVVIFEVNGIKVIKHQIQEVSVGQNVTLDCKLDSSLQGGFSLHWIRYENEQDKEVIGRCNSNSSVTGSRRFSIIQSKSNYQLNISPVIFNDSYAYYCSIIYNAKNIIDISNEIIINVHERPEDPFCYIRSAENYEQTPVCETNIRGDLTYWIQRNTSSTYVDSWVTSTSICYVNNSFGVPSRTCVIDNQCTVQHNHSGLLVVGEKAKFTCDCKSQISSNSITWTLYNKTDFCKHNLEGNILRIHVYQNHHGVLIQCTVKNSTHDISSGWLMLQIVNQYSPIYAPTVSTTVDKATTNNENVARENRYVFTRSLKTYSVKMTTVSPDNNLIPNDTVTSPKNFESPITTQKLSTEDIFSASSSLDMSFSSGGNQSPNTESSSWSSLSSNSYDIDTAISTISKSSIPAVQFLSTKDSSTVSSRSDVSWLNRGNQSPTIEPNKLSSFSTHSDDIKNLISTKTKSSLKTSVPHEFTEISSKSPFTNEDATDVLLQDCKNDRPSPTTTNQILSKAVVKYIILFATILCATIVAVLCTGHCVLKCRKRQRANVKFVIDLEGVVKREEHPISKEYPYINERRENMLFNTFYSSPCEEYEEENHYCDEVTDSKDNDEIKDDTSYKSVENPIYNMNKIN